MKLSRKPRKYHSMRFQISLLFVGMLLLSMVSIMAVNILFLEKYYILQKQEVLLEAMETLASLDLDSILQTDDVADETEGEKPGNIQADIPTELEQTSSKNNLSWVIIDATNTRWAYWGENERVLRSKLFGYAFGVDSDGQGGQTLEQSDTYVVQQIHDEFAGMDYVECWGIFNDGEYYFIIRTPLASIQESVSISNKFYLFVGTAILALSVIIVMWMTRKLTRPISELVTLSQKMSDLNFEAKYQSHAGNEVDVLGDNFNRMSEQLEQTVSELKMANNELQKDIENKIKIDEMRKEFLNNVAHELKTPIALVQGYAEGLKENISEDPESREFYCDVIMDEAGKMNKLVRNLLTLNQLESGGDAMVMERFDITTVIRGVLDSMAILIEQKEARVIFEQKEPVYVWADEFKIEEVVTNYTSNALNHLEGAREIEIKVLEKEDRVCITVFNTGQPIPEEDLPNLWNKFYKVDKARTREYGGSGIGLSIVKAIIEGLNQEYGVQNYDNGVEFWFTLDRK